MAGSKEERAEYMREYRKRRADAGNPVRSGPRDYTDERLKSIKRNYGITPEQAFELLEKQGDKCAICDTPVSLFMCTARSAIDHCHTTGRVRGILCMQCNQGLGKFRDSPEFLRKAAAYLAP